MADEKKDHLRCRVIIEVLGKPKEHVEKAIKLYVQKIKEDSGLIILQEQVVDAKEQGQLWSTFAELEMLVKGTQKLIEFCFDYMPSSIEIIKPEQVIFKNREISNFFNDLQAKLHTVDMVAKNLRVENEFLKKNMKTSFKNLIMVLLKIRDAMSEDELSKFTGIPKKEIGTILKDLLNEAKIKKDGENFLLAQ